MFKTNVFKMAECKYYKQVRQVSYDSGVTWISLDEYQKGDLYENDSPDCGGGITQYKWVNVSGEYTCVGTTKYQKTKKQQSTDGGQTWTDVNPPEYSTGAVIERDSSDCGGSCLPFLEYCCGRGSHSDCDIQLESASGSRVYDTMYICGESDIGYEVYVTNTLPSWLKVRVYRNDVGFETLEENIGATRYFTVELESNHSSAQRRCTEGGNLNSYCTTASVVVKQLGGSDYANQYLTLVARGSGAFKKYDHSGTFQYSKNNGSTWTNATSATTIYVSNGDRVMFKGTLTPKNSGVGRGIGIFSASTQFEAEGNPMSLLFGDNFSGQTSLSGKNYAFFNLFGDCSGLTSISNLSLPATTLSDYCYYAMFMNCTSLTSIPSGLLPATTLADSCYSSMFGDTAIVSIPSGFLPATTLASNCYDMMFENCASLTSVPNNLLPATTLTTRCYQRLFAGCTSLTTVPSNLLPVMTLTQGCYDMMFSGCTSLTTAPELQATTLVDYCYSGMFEYCTNLTYVKCLATNISAYWCTQWWLYNVSSSGTFVKNSSMSSWSRGKDGIPNNWTIQNA